MAGLEEAVIRESEWEVHRYNAAKLFEEWVLPLITPLNPVLQYAILHMTYNPGRPRAR